MELAALGARDGDGMRNSRYVQKAKCYRRYYWTLKRDLDHAEYIQAITGIQVPAEMIYYDTYCEDFYSRKQRLHKIYMRKKYRKRWEKSSW